MIFPSVRLQPQLCTYADVSYESLAVWTAIHPESVVDEDVRNTTRLARTSSMSFYRLLLFREETTE
jgi:hypothetical protein